MARYLQKLCGSRKRMTRKDEKRQQKKANKKKDEGKVDSNNRSWAYDSYILERRYSQSPDHSDIIRRSFGTDLAILIVSLRVVELWCSLPKDHD